MNKAYMKKRGQVTLYIVVGILLVIIIGLFIYVLRPEELKRNQILSDSVPSKFSPVQNFVQSCILDVGEKAVRLAGERGGYIFSRNYPMLGFDLNPDFEEPTESDSFYVHLYRDVPVPYWYYMNAPNGMNVFSYSDEIPPLKSEEDNGKLRETTDISIEAQIDRYVSRNLNDCLNNFNSFKEQGVLITPLNQVPVTTTYVRDNDVAINVFYPVSVNISGDTETISNFGEALPVRLENSYDLAQLITQAEAEYHFLENQIINLIVINAMVDSDLLPPMNDFTFNFGSEGNFWQEAAVKENMKYILTSVNKLQVNGAKNYNRIMVTPEDAAYETRQKVYDNMILDLAPFYPDDVKEISYEDTKVNFNYFEWWNIYFDANDQGGEIRPKFVGVDFELIKLGFQRYETFYDISWPVLVTLEDTESFAGKGFTFNFGLEGNIVDNEPLNSSYKPETYGFDSVTICDKSQRTKNTTISVYGAECDEENNCLPPIDEASISLVVGKKSCSLGTTDYEGKLTASVPAGVLGADIKAVKEGYLGEFVTYTDNADFVIKGMRRMKTMNFTVLKKTLSKVNGSWMEFNDTPQNLEEGDEVFVTMTRLREEEEPFTAFFSAKYGETYEGDFVEGTYTIEGMLLGQKNPETTAQMLADLEALKNSVSPSDFDSLMNSVSNSNEPSGGINFGYVDDNDIGNPVTFLKADVDAGSNIILYVLELKDLNITDIDDLTALGDIKELTRRYQSELIPEIR